MALLARCERILRSARTKSFSRLRKPGRRSPAFATRSATFTTSRFACDLLFFPSFAWLIIVLSTEQKTIAILKADRHSATTVEPNFSPPPCSPGPAAAFPKKFKPSTTTAPKASSSKPPPLSKAKRSKPREPTPEEDEEAEDFSEQLRGVASKSGGFDSDDDNEDEEETAAAARATVAAKSKGKGKARAIVGGNSISFLLSDQC
jgi:hypothetical protein